MGWVRPQARYQLRLKPSVWNGNKRSKAIVGDRAECEWNGDVHIMKLSDDGKSFVVDRIQKNATLTMRYYT